MRAKKPRQKSNRPYYSSDYRKVGRNHNAWYEKAGGLAQAALLLRARVVADFIELDEYMQGLSSERETVRRFPLYRIYPIYMMLVGLSIENVLKSICVVRYPDSVKDQMNKKLTVHDVYELATARLHLEHVLTEDKKNS